ncbi:MAG: hypothetical protein ACOY5F_18655 [Pseudomonadota bacterium]
MSAMTIYHNAPLGSVIRYSDGTPKPPARFARKLRDWKNRNGTGRLMKKEPPRERPTYCSPACFTLHEGDIVRGGIILVTMMRTYSVDSTLRFELMERPTIGMVRVLQSIGDTTELLHLAENREAAERWLSKNHYSNVRLEEVTADEVGADVIEAQSAA